MYYSQRITSRSRSGHRSGSFSRIVKIADIVNFINTTPSGSVRLRNVRDYLDVHTRSSVKLKAAWKVLSQNKENFFLSDQQKNVKDLTGEETVWVKTVLSLCKTHCRRGKDGRNRACDGDCGALHVCRTFLLSGDACPFNSNQKRCMFGHDFDTDHNIELLKKHNLYGLHEKELQRLFRRRYSRNAITLPQVCIYYNKANGKGCANENCKSLHLCSDFIQQCCQGACSRNHKLTTPQVGRVLELFAIDKTWSPEMLLEDLRHFMTPRHRNVFGNHSSVEDSGASDDSKPGDQFNEHFVGKTPSSLSLDESNPCPSYFGQSQNCEGCELMKLEVNKMKVTISRQTTQIADLKKSVDGLKMSITSSTRLSNQQPDGIEEAEIETPEIETPNPGPTTMTGLPKVKTSNLLSLRGTSSNSKKRKSTFRRLQYSSFSSGFTPTKQLKF